MSGSSVSRDIRVSGVSRVIGYALSLGSTIVISHSIGTAGKGVLSLGAALPGLVATLACVGLGSAVTIASREGWLPRVRAVVMFLAYVLALGFFFAWAGALDSVARALGLGTSAVALPVMVSIGGLMLTDFCGGLLQGAGRVAEGMWLRQAIGIGQSIVAIVLLLVGYRSSALLLWWIAAWSWTCAIAGVPLVARLPATPVATPVHWLRRLVGLGFRTQAVWILLLLNYRLDMAILGAIGTLSQVGVYSVSVGFSEVAWFGANAVASVLLPHLCNIEPRLARARAVKALRLSVVTTALLAVAIGVGLWALAVPLFGRGFAGATVAFLALSPGLVALAAFKVIAIHDMATGHRMEPILLAAAGVGINVAANLLLVPALASTGAALASSISYTAISAAAGFSFARRAGMRIQDLIWVNPRDLYGSLVDIVRRRPA